MTSGKRGKGKHGEREKGKHGEREKGKCGEREKGKWGEREKGKCGKRETKEGGERKRKVREQGKKTEGTHTVFADGEGAKVIQKIFRPSDEPSHWNPVLDAGRHELLGRPPTSCGICQTAEHGGVEIAVSQCRRAREQPPRREQ
jgi:hypothetical protein